MSKREQKEAQQVVAWAQVLGLDYAARALSAMHRASLREKSKAEIAALARSLGADRSSEWRV